MHKHLSRVGQMIAGAVIGLALTAAPASATSYVFNLAANPADGSTGSFSSGASYFVTYELELPVGAPITLISGDDITLNLTLNSALTVPGGAQFLGVNIRTDDPGNASTTGLITFSGLTGSIANPQSGSCGNCLSNIIFTAGNSYSFTALSSVATYLFDTPVTFESMSLSYQVETPLPAALPLLATGLGAMGLLGWRRKRRAQAAA